MTVNRSEIRREANILAAQAIRVMLSEGATWHDDWSYDENVKLSVRMGEIAEAIERR